MRLVISLIIIVYLVGVGVVLAPVIQSAWNSETASAFFDSIGKALPDALTWPVRLAHANARPCDGARLNLARLDSLSAPCRQLATIR
jgi:hypothetical protein